MTARPEQGISPEDLTELRCSAARACMRNVDGLPAEYRALVHQYGYGVWKAYLRGWTPDHDDLHVDGEIGAAGACYALSGTGWTHKLITPLTMLWPWSLDWWKPRNARRDLVKAGALILAEIERRDRAAAKDDAHDQ